MITQPCQSDQEPVLWLSVGGGIRVCPECSRIRTRPCGQSPLPPLPDSAYPPGAKKLAPPLIEQMASAAMAVETNLSWEDTDDYGQHIELERAQAALEVVRQLLSEACFFDAFDYLTEEGTVDAA